MNRWKRKIILLGEREKENRNILITFSNATGMSTIPQNSDYLAFDGISDDLYRINIMYDDLRPTTDD